MPLWYWNSKVARHLETYHYSNLGLETALLTADWDRSVFKNLIFQSLNWEDRSIWHRWHAGLGPKLSPEKVRVISGQCSKLMELLSTSEDSFTSKAAAVYLGKEGSALLLTSYLSALVCTTWASATKTLGISHTQDCFLRFQLMFCEGMHIVCLNVDPIRNFQRDLSSVRNPDSLGLSVTKIFHKAIRPLSVYYPFYQLRLPERRFSAFASVTFDVRFACTQIVAMSISDIEMCCDLPILKIVWMSVPTDHQRSCTASPPILPWWL